MLKSSQATIGKYLKFTCIIILVFLCFYNTSYSAEIDGFKNLKFGMTLKEAHNTNLYKDGIILFGKRRYIAAGTDGKGDKRGTKGR